MADNVGQELATLDFQNLIGGPLNAIVKAQAESAVTTTKFIREVGFDKDGSVINANFSYSKNNADGEKEDFTLSVPYISMLPIPYLAIEEATVEFNANITSTQTQSSSEESNTDINGSGSAKIGIPHIPFLSASISMKVNHSQQKRTQNDTKIEKTYSMKVMVRARGTELPTGTDRILSILENVITETPTGILNETIKDLTLATNQITATDEKLKDKTIISAYLGGKQLKLDAIDATTGAITITKDKFEDTTVTDDNLKDLSSKILEVKYKNKN